MLIQKCILVFKFFFSLLFVGVNIDIHIDHGVPWLLGECVEVVPLRHQLGGGAQQGQVPQVLPGRAGQVRQAASPEHQGGVQSPSPLHHQHPPQLIHGHRLRCR